MVNLELFRIFVIVAKEQNITKASEKLNISQPAVTKHIKNLENQLNETLFIRTNGMILTAKGKELYEKIEPAINILEETERIYEDNNKTINFGTYSTMLSKVLSGCISDFYKENKNTKISIITDPHEMLMDKFSHYELDLLFAEENDKLINSADVKYIKCGEAKFVFVTNSDFKNISKEINITDLQNQEIYVPRGNTISKKHFMSLLEENNIQCNINSIDSVTMLNIIKQSGGIGFTSLDYAREDIEAKKLIKLETSFEIISTEYGIYFHQNNSSPEIKKLIKILKNYKNYNQ